MNTSVLPMARFALDSTACVPLLNDSTSQGTQDIPTDPSTTLTSLIGQVTTPVMQRAKRKMEWETPANTRSRYTPMTPFSTKAEMPRIPTSARPPPGYRVPSSPIVNNDPWNMDTSASSGPSSVAAHSSPVSPDFYSSPTPDPILPIIPSTVFSAAPTSDAILKYVTPMVMAMKDACVAHYVLQQENQDHHTQLRFCDYPLRSKDSHYYTQFRRQMNDRQCNILACWTCWCPVPYPALGHHEQDTGRRCSEHTHQDFWRGISYLIWRCTPLREAVFGFLHVDHTLLIGTSVFAKWLIKPASTFTPNRKISNLVAIVYAYLCLQEQGALPSGALTLDGKQESLLSFQLLTLYVIRVTEPITSYDG
ncbi:hypothetical protein FPV67DRAFT_1450194 [Lyophyllum atratum]|nr:hypothetical protein FPV67DRAFT_1450194 [Lyophyllum atratum]